METQNLNQRLCGSRLYSSANCHSKVRKIAENKFEKIYLCGQHAFNYSVITQNKVSNNLKETIFPNRKMAINFFTATLKNYNNE